MHNALYICSKLYRMKILLSPAKKIDLAKRVQTKETSTPKLMSEASYLAKKLKGLSAKKIGDMMKLSPELADLNYERYQSWSEEVKLSDDTARAIEAFDGEVYRGFDALSLNEKELKLAQDKVRILSGLYGILRPLDVIHPYRLEMGTKWAVTSAKKNLYAYWGDKVIDQLNAEESELIVNLASTEYFKVLPKKKLKTRVITPVFKEFKNGEYKVVMVYAKKARGMMARYIVENNTQEAEMIKGFDTDGYGFDANLSSENEWVFTR